MKLSNRFTRTSVAVLALIMAPAIIFTACGGKGTNPSTGGIGGTTRAVVQHFLTAIPGFHGSLKTQTVAMLDSTAEAFSANAQTVQQVAYTGNYNGFCQSVPNGNSFVVYGLGRLSDSNCAFNFTNIVGTNDGEPVIGNGTLQNIVVLAQGGASAQSGTLEIFVNGVSKATTAAIGTNKKLADLTTAVPVLDGDVVAAVFHTLPGDNFQNVRVYIGKQ